MTARRATALDRGETLVELVVSVFILGVAAVAIVAGLTLSVQTSDLHRKEATASAVVRDYAETIENAVAAGGYQSGTGSYAAYSAPSGYAATVTAKNCWTTSSTWATCTAGNDIGVQQLTLKVASTDGQASEKLVVIVRLPCAQGQTVCS